MVREVKAEHLETIKDLIQRTFTQCTEGCCGDALTNYLENEITKDQLWYYLVEDKPVAVLGVRDNKEITACYTEEAYQGKGAAKELFEAVKAILMARGSFTLTVKATEGSAGFFEKLGFRTVTVDDACSCCIPMVYKF